jgi:hypothetical protein
VGVDKLTVAELKQHLWTAKFPQALTEYAVQAGCFLLYFMSIIVDWRGGWS